MREKRKKWLDVENQDEEKRSDGKKKIKDIIVG